jgi:hypothetical protein
MSFLDAIFGSKKKEIVKYCNFRKKEITIGHENILAHYRMTMYCYVCQDSYEYYTQKPCNEKSCVYYHMNAFGADHAIENSPYFDLAGSTNAVLYKKVSGLSLDKYTDLILDYRKKEGVKNYCK